MDIIATLIINRYIYLPLWISNQMRRAFPAGLWYNPRMLDQGLL